MFDETSGLGHGSVIDQNIAGQDHTLALLAAGDQTPLDQQLV
jgi:hypothetical protein